MINININPQAHYGYGAGRVGSCGTGQCGGTDPMLQQMGELMMGMADMFLSQGCNNRGRGRAMSRSLRDAFDDPGKDEVKIKQKEGKKGKKVPPDVEFKGDARNLPAILRAANAGTK